MYLSINTIVTYEIIVNCIRGIYVVIPHEVAKFVCADMKRVLTCYCIH